MSVSGKREVFTSKLVPGLVIEIMLDFSAEDAEKFAEEEANINNRPQKSGAIKRYAGLMLRKEWDLNGETFIQDEKERAISGRNRSKAVLLAEKKRKQNPDYYKEEFGLTGPVKIPAIVVRGIKAKCYRSVDSGEKRTGRDMFYVAKVFDDFKGEDKKPEFSNSQKKKLAGILATAARTVWLRLEGKDVSDAPGFPPAAQEDFVKKHPLLIDCVAHVFRCDEGGGAERNIQSLVSPAYMAAVMYLGSVMKTDREDYDERGAEAINDELMEDANVFVDSFATGANLDAGHPALILRKLYAAQKRDAAEGKGKRDRDVVLNMLVKAMTLYLDEKTDLKPTDLKWNPAKEDVPRLGGLDTVVEVAEPPVEEEAPEASTEAEEGEEEAPKKPAKRKTKKAKKATAEAAA